jgi:putative endonuclease
MAVNPLRRNKGQWAEDLALTHLDMQGLQLITRNYRYRRGEIDLIMQHQTILVFIEVRYRASHYCGSSAESIDYTKQQRILMTASHYLQTHQQAQSFPCRFDAVLINGSQKSPQIQWIQDAFRG